MNKNCQVLDLEPLALHLFPSSRSIVRNQASYLATIETDLGSTRKLRNKTTVQVHTTLSPRNPKLTMLDLYASGRSSSNLRYLICLTPTERGRGETLSSASSQWVTRKQHPIRIHHHPQISHIKVINSVSRGNKALYRPSETKHRPCLEKMSFCFTSKLTGSLSFKP